jgi:nucleolar pre-ribosomal-associated protein 2
LQPSYHALVELEKGSPGSPREQLREAARIIAVGLDSYGSEADTDGNRADVTQLTSRISVPKEEWVLRWLMKKLKASQGDGKAGHRLDKYAWILLRVLVDRIPPKPLAAILGEHKILNILEDTLRSVEGLTASGGDEASFGTGKDLPTPVSSKGGRKRKRAESAANNSLPSSGPDRSSSWVDILLAVLEAVDRYVSLLSRIPANQAAIRSQVKLVLRVDTGMAAGLLGRALSLVEEALKQLPDAAIPDTTGLQRRMLRSLLSIVAIWDVRSDSDSPGTSGNVSAT